MEQIITTPQAKESKSCNMQYEIFDLGNRQIIEDPERESEMKKFIDDLGLAGQKQLIVEQDGSIIPFPKMNVTDERVWSMVCPEKCRLEKYDSQVIPFEILELIAMVKTKGYFEIDKVDETTQYSGRPLVTKGYIEIWDRPKEQIDPLVIGVIQSGYKNSDETYLYNEKKAHYLLARWGHELIPFASIVEHAKKLWTEKRAADARRSIAKAKQDILESEKAIEGIEADAIDHFSGQFVSFLPF